MPSSVRRKLRARPAWPPPTMTTSIDLIAMPVALPWPFRYPRPTVGPPLRTIRGRRRHEQPTRRLPTTRSRRASRSFPGGRPIGPCLHDALMVSIASLSQLDGGRRRSPRAVVLRRQRVPFLRQDLAIAQAQAAGFRPRPPHQAEADRSKARRLERRGRGSFHHLLGRRCPTSLGIRLRWPTSDRLRRCAIGGFES